ncbi:hypothetical protein RRG08_066870 [Elysia crispata]|uniref:Uncharacterized protein n=1 Tax=Elysia crispata TaxID=231223 RepID=A0AAE0YL64_9GAST|nr:hypothetical protein RRG08_066870 [Elysia crispata]
MLHAFDSSKSPASEGPKNVTCTRYLLSLQLPEGPVYAKCILDSSKSPASEGPVNAKHALVISKSPASGEG